MESNEKTIEYFLEYTIKEPWKITKPVTILEPQEKIIASWEFDLYIRSNMELLTQGDPYYNGAKQYWFLP